MPIFCISVCPSCMYHFTVCSIKKKQKTLTCFCKMISFLKTSILSNGGFCKCSSMVFYYLVKPPEYRDQNFLRLVSKLKAPNCTLYSRGSGFYFYPEAYNTLIIFMFQKTLKCNTQAILPCSAHSQCWSKPALQ